jgi:hypothetical protein
MLPLIEGAKFKSYSKARFSGGANFARDIKVGLFYSCIIGSDSAVVRLDEIRVLDDGSVIGVVSVLDEVEMHSSLRCPVLEVKEEGVEVAVTNISAAVHVVPLCVLDTGCIIRNSSPRPDGVNPLWCFPMNGSHGQPRQYLLNVFFVK